MSLSREDAAAMDRREQLTAQETKVVDSTFVAVFAIAKEYGVPLAGDDRAAAVEAAIIRWIEASRS